MSGISPRSERRRSARRLVAVVTAVLLVVAGGAAVGTAPAGAAAGDLDPTFSGDGVVHVGGPSGGGAFFHDVAVAADGTMTAAGMHEDGAGGFGLLVVRVLPDGALDPSFGDGDGIALLTPSSHSDAQSVVLAPDGKVVVAGRTGDPAEILVARFNADGTLDPSFGDQGLAVHGLEYAQEYAFGVALDRQGRVLVAAEGNDGLSDFHFLTLRLLSDGDLDPSFDADGIVVEERGTADGARAVAPDADGRVLAAGALGEPFDSEGVLVRYNADGTRDTTFGTDGMVSEPLGPEGLTQGVFQSLVVDGNAPIVGGTNGAFDSGAQSFSVHRYDPAGAPDPGFGGGDGVAMARGNGSWRLLDLDRRADGFLVATGSQQTGERETLVIRTAVAQFGPDGSLDPAFSGDGMTTALTGENDEGLGVAYDSDGRPVVVGRSSSGASTSALVLRFQNHTRVVTVPAGGTASTGTSPSPGDPVTTSVTTPNAGTVSITESAVSIASSGGFTFLGIAVDIDAPAASAANPLRIVFRLDASVVDAATGAPLADDVAGLRVFRNGSALADCAADAGGAADPDPCMAAKTVEGDDVVLDIRTSAASTWTFGVAVAGGAPGNGYWMAASDGGVFTFGSAGFFGSMGSVRLNQPVVGVAAAPDGNGYWLVAPDGGVFTFGSAGFFGSMGGTPLNKPIVGIAAAPDGEGYWLVASDGGVFAFGSAGFFGSTGDIRLNQPVVAIAAAPDGEGYWMTAVDGGVFSFGSASFLGSMGATPLNKPVVGLAAAPDGDGYWLVASDGGVFTFGSAGFFGSMGAVPLNEPVMGMAAAPDGGGYWMAALDGGVFTFGSAGFFGSMGGTPLNQPVVGIAAA